MRLLRLWGLAAKTYHAYSRLSISLHAKVLSILACSSSRSHQNPFPQHLLRQNWRRVAYSLPSLCFRADLDLQAYALGLANEAELWAEVNGSV